MNCVDREHTGSIPISSALVHKFHLWNHSIFGFVEIAVCFVVKDTRVTFDVGLPDQRLGILEAAVFPRDGRFARWLAHFSIHCGSSAEWHNRRRLFGLLQFDTTRAFIVRKFLCMKVQDMGSPTFRGSKDCQL